MLLNLWYSDRCTRHIKLMVCIATCAVIFYCTEIQKLPTVFAIISLSLGIATHILYQYTQKLGENNNYALLGEGVEEEAKVNLKNMINKIK